MTSSGAVQGNLLVEERFICSANGRAFNGEVSYDGTPFVFHEYDTATK